MPNPTPFQKDVRADHHGSLILLSPLSPKGQAWLEENLTGETTWFNGSAVVEPRYLYPILVGIADAGLVLVR